MNNTFIQKGDIVKDNITKKIEKVVNITTNSVLVTQSKILKPWIKSPGIDCDNWFGIVSFQKRFTFYEPK